jgi:hypothetical protein
LDGSVATEKNKIHTRNKQVEIVEMDDEELYFPNDVLEAASAVRYQMLPKKSTLRYQKDLRENENQ